MTVDYDAARQVIERGIAKGKIIPPTKRGRGRPRRMCDTGDMPRKLCPKCERMVVLVKGRMMRHRMYADSRGYSTGAWCNYKEHDDAKGN